MNYQAAWTKPPGCCDSCRRSDHVASSLDSVNCSHARTTHNRTYSGLSLSSNAATSIINSLSLSLSFNGYFPREPGFIGAKDDRDWGETCKAAIKSSPPTNQHPTFYRLDVLPVAQPTASKHWRENQSQTKLKITLSAKNRNYSTFTCLPFNPLPVHGPYCLSTAALKIFKRNLSRLLDNAKMFFYKLYAIPDAQTTASNHWRHSTVN